MASTRPSAGMTRIRFKGHRTTGYAGLPRYLSPAGGAPLGNGPGCGGPGQVSNGRRRCARADRKWRDSDCACGNNWTSVDDLYILLHRPNNVPKKGCVNRMLISGMYIASICPSGAWQGE